MKTIIAIAAMAMAALTANAQESGKTFSGNFQNDEYNVYIVLDLEGKGIVVPNHEIFGELPGYLAKRRNSFYWLITAGEVVSPKLAKLEMINDYGSEDLKATLTMKDDSTFVLTHGEGSALKVPNNGKWQKLPKKLELKKTR